ncbi:MAG: alkaline phosphatase family protein, partial [Rhizobiales bacterium]|nr:alkaline phosphatase family protein [Hyphomicrobiales bacterium]
MRPNVLLITADQWRGDCLGIAGHPVVKTPNIDRLASRGTWFARHYTQCSPCGPSRASLYTGLYQMNHRVVRNGTPLDRRHDTIALAMRRLGYRPTLFGYTDQAADPRTEPPDSPWLRTYEGILPGFEVGLRLPEDPEPWLDRLVARGHERPANFWDIYRPADGGGKPSRAPARFSEDESEAAFLTDAFLDWHATQGAEPWFAHVSYLSPHPPFVAPAPFNDLYDPASGPAFRAAPSAGAERELHPLLAFLHDTTMRDHYIVGAGKDRVADWSEDAFRLIRATYWGMVSEVDRQIGRLAERIGDDTVIILTSDHGEMLGDHFMLGKAGFFDQAFHVPLIIADPRRAGAGRVDAFTEAVDVMPTVLALAGGEAPRHLDGCSLAPFLAGEAPTSWRDAIHFEFDFRDVEHGTAQATLGLALDTCSLAVHRGARFKYVHFAGLPPLLFDLEQDPDELANLAEDPAF